jgi:LemA protein
MKKYLVPGIIIVAILLLIVKQYNGAIALREDVKNAWGDVENSYQRRADLIPNLVSTVKGYAAHEKETLEGVIKARAEATATKIDAGDLTPEKIAAFQKAQSGLAGALSKLMVVVERYPDLKANQNFLELQSQLEGTENRINVARDRYNKAVNPYNNRIKGIPFVFVAKLLGFNEMDYYKSEPESKTAPKVEF